LAQLAQADGAPTAQDKQAFNEIELETLTVVGSTPIDPKGLPREKVSANVQSVEDEDIQRHESLNLTDFMRRNLASVTANDDQNNPYQPNISYRGYFASPLLGTPIGLSVYQDGVRVNEAFGDTVNWDLIPQVAIANMDVIPGSNPLFGLNTLGGALSVRTKSGFTHSGARAQTYGGSFGRKSFQAEYGGYKGDFDWFFAGNVSEDDGWRPFSHSAVRQAFGKAGWQNETTDVDLSFTFADNKLNGVGPTPDGLYALNPSAIYTARDYTENTLYFFNLQGKHQFNDYLSLAGNSYYRGNTVNTLNSNTGNLEQSCDSLQDCQDQGVYPASNLAGRTVQDGSGVNLQLIASHPIFEHENQLTVGGGYNGGHSHFTQSGQDGVLNDQRVVLGATPFFARVDVKGTNDYYNAFVTDTFSVTPWAHVNSAVSWNKADIHLSDKMGTALNGDHSFERWNPSAGFTLNPLKALDLEKSAPLEELTVYGNYNEGFRAPTPVELTCADPNAPCSLPNSFVSDPSLKPVVSQTFEVGVRGVVSAALRWSMALYHSRLSNDIGFVNSTGSNQTGYFQNVGTTQRQGGELGLNGVWDKLNWYMNYSFVDATYQSAAVLNSALGPVYVRPGDYIPGIPQQSFKMGAEYEILKGWFFGGDLQYASSQWARGDDSNRYPKVQEYAVVNLNTRYQVTKNLEVFAMARNVFDAKYQTFGVMNNNFFTGQGERFLGPGAPIAGWAGLRVSFE
jgi:outer membrane receptor protein involved in Fe transport